MMQKKLVKAKNFLEKIGIVAILQVVVLPSMMSAQTNMPNVAVPTNIDIGTIIGKIQSYFFGIVIITCVFLVLWGALDLTTSGGDENKVTSAKRRIMYAAVGLVIAALSMSIVSLLMSLF
jgi:hypothetical protein